jgi:acetaldehyde dehydrogenase (acetylating)
MTLRKTMTGQDKWPVAIIGSGNIGTDLMIKIVRDDGPLTMAVMVGIDPDSDGLARAARMGVPTTAGGVDGLVAMPHFADIRMIFDATSAGAHRANWAKLADTGVRMLDLTPAAIGPYCVPVVNLDDHLDASNLNMVTCGGQATCRSWPRWRKAGLCRTPRSCRRSRRSRPVRAPAPASMTSSKPLLPHCKSSVAPSAARR